MPRTAKIAKPAKPAPAIITTTGDTDHGAYNNFTFIIQPGIKGRFNWEIFCPPPGKSFGNGFGNSGWSRNKSSAIETAQKRIDLCYQNSENSGGWGETIAKPIPEGYAYEVTDTFNGQKLLSGWISRIKTPKTPYGDNWAWRSTKQTAEDSARISIQIHKAAPANH